MNPPTDREKALAEALEDIAKRPTTAYLIGEMQELAYLEEAYDMLISVARQALTAPTPAAPTDGPWCYDLEDGSLTRDKEFFAYVRDDCGGPLIAENALILLAALNRQQEAQP